MMYAVYIPRVFNVRVTVHTRMISYVIESPIRSNRSYEAHEEFTWAMRRGMAYHAHAIQLQGMGQQKQHC